MNNRFIDAFYKSFYSRKFYRNVGLNWGVKTFAALFLLLALSWLTVAITRHLEFNKFMDEHQDDIIAKIPAVRITDGVVSSDVEQPYEIAVGEGKDRVVIGVLDTTGKINSLNDTPAHFLVTRTEIHSRQQGQTKVQSLGKLNLEMTQEKLKSWAVLIKTWGIPVIMFLGFLFSIFYRAVIALIYSLIALIVSSSTSTELGYYGCLKIATMSMVPIVIVDTIHSLAGSPIPGFIWWFICVGSSCGLIAMGVTACKQQPELEPERGESDSWSGNQFEG